MCVPHSTTSLRFGVGCCGLCLCSNIHVPMIVARGSSIPLRGVFCPNTITDPLGTHFNMQTRSRPVDAASYVILLRPIFTVFYSHQPGQTGGGASMVARRRDMGKATHRLPHSSRTDQSGVPTNQKLAVYLTPPPPHRPHNTDARKSGSNQGLFVPKMINDSDLLKKETKYFRKFGFKTTHETGFSILVHEAGR